MLGSRVFRLPPNQCIFYDFRGSPQCSSNRTLIEARGEEIEWTRIPCDISLRSFGFPALLCHVSQMVVARTSFTVWCRSSGDKLVRQSSLSLLMHQAAAASPAPCHHVVTGRIS